MYKITWDKETGGIQLNLHVVEDTLSVSPRPVFFEELDLLKLNEAGWTYPRCEEPIMWACNKQYYYRGDLLFEVSGANIYDAPTVKYAAGVTPGKLKSVNVKAMLQKNKDPLFLIESEAIDFIRDTYLAYSAATESFARVPANQIVEQLKERQEQKTKQKMAIVKQDCDSFDVMPLEAAQEQGKRIFQTTKIDFFLASFSGGKDSQVILDLCTRAIPPSAFQVIYSDTGYELPSSLNLYKEVQEFYSKKFPDLKFSTAANHAPVLDYWDKIGTPTDTHRWCCSIMKTAPLYRCLKLPGTNKQGKVLTFDGVRAEESQRRSAYQRIGKGKHTNIFNAHPILLWNTSEIFLYLFKYKLPINPAYRFGKARVGCLICPFSSAWDDMIANKYYPKELAPFVERLSSWAQKNGVKDTASYLRERKWKMKTLGDRDSIKTDVRFAQKGDSFMADITGAHFPIYSWLPTIGKFSVNKLKDCDKGELNFNGGIYSFEIKYHANDHITFTLSDCKDNKLLTLIKRVIYKSSYCVQCEVCEVDCPTGALQIYPELKIDNSKCIHCHKCLDAHDRGCIATDCIRMLKDSDKNATAKVQAYKTFGFHEDWLSEYFSDPDGFWVTNSLGSAQVDGFKMWLKHAEIIDAKLAITPFGKALKDAYIDDINFTWEAILINLSYNSFIVNWFANNVAIGQAYDKGTLVEAIMEQGVDGTKKTVESAVAALIQTFNYSPIGAVLNYAETKDNKAMLRGAYEDISDKGLAYSIYKYAEMQGVRSLRVADFYDPDCVNSPCRVLGITKSVFEKTLRSLSSSSVGILNADLNMGLDNISLRDDVSSVSIVEAIL